MADMPFAPDTFELSWGKSVMIPLKPEVEYTIIAYMQIPMDGTVAVARITRKVKQNEVVQYVYRIAEQPGHSHEEIYKQAQLVEVAVL